MFEQSRRLNHRVLGRDWVEVMSYTDGQSLAVGYCRRSASAGSPPTAELPRLDIPYARKWSQDNNQWARAARSIYGTPVDTRPLGFGCTFEVTSIEMPPADRAEHTAQRSLSGGASPSGNLVTN